MKTQPAIFLKMLVLLVPRELQIEHRGGVKGMTEEQIVDAIEAIEGFRSALGYGPRRAATRGATRKISRALPEMPRIFWFSGLSH